MTFFRSFLLVCPAACLLAQTPPPPKPAEAAPKSQAPPITLKLENPTPGLPAVPPDTVVLTVGDTKITAAEFDQLIAALPSQYQSQMHTAAGRKQFADSYAQVLTLVQEGKRRHVDEDSNYKAQVAFQSANILAGLTYQQMSKDLKLDDAELHKYYDEHKADFEEVHARHILIRFKGSPLAVKPGEKDLTEEEALAKAQEVRKKLVDGGDFASLASQESDDTQTAAHGGDLSFFRHNQMVPPFDEAAFKLAVGELSQPVKTPFGYHLIKVDEKRSKSFEDAKDEIERRLRPEMARKQLDDLQKKAGVTLDPAFFGTQNEKPKP
jgi:peptidyl-prolyl cis-trans isomerase C